MVYKPNPTIIILNQIIDKEYKKTANEVIKEIKTIWKESQKKYLELFITTVKGMEEIANQDHFQTILVNNKKIKEIIDNMEKDKIETFAPAGYFFEIDDTSSYFEDIIKTSYKYHLTIELINRHKYIYILRLTETEPKYRIYHGN
jgi:hypothetical protein